MSAINSMKLIIVNIPVICTPGKDTIVNQTPCDPHKGSKSISVKVKIAIPNN
jgi:hypothetical protein